MLITPYLAYFHLTLLYVNPPFHGVLFLWHSGISLNQTGSHVPACRYIQSTCATSGEGLYEGLDWLSSNIAKKVSQRRLQLRLLSLSVFPTPHIMRVLVENLSGVLNQVLEVEFSYPTKLLNLNVGVFCRVDLWCRANAESACSHVDSWSCTGWDWHIFYVVLHLVLCIHWVLWTTRISFNWMCVPLVLFFV